jgi:hypothetical protein
MNSQLEKMEARNLDANPEQNRVRDGILEGP